MTFADFILAHENDDPAALLLARHRYPDIDIDLAATTLEGRRRLRRKVPSWYALPSLVYPTRLCTEQCSSEETARLKATAALGMTEGGGKGRRIADLTGGLGVDAWAFSQVFSEVLYNEMQPELAEAAERNFAALGVQNIRIRSACLEPGSLAGILGDFRPDILYLDPARRAEDGRKVFRLADCRPDVRTLLPELLAACPDIFVKLSPMADITQLSRELPGLKAVTVVGAAGECKELLLHIRRGHEGPFSLTVTENGATLALLPEAVGTAGEGAVRENGVFTHGTVESEGAVRENACFTHGAAENGGAVRKNGEITHGTVESEGAVRKNACFTHGTGITGLLFEPGKALAKAGVFKQLERRYAIRALGASTHLYTGTSIPEELLPFGKVFVIEEVLPLGKETFRTLKKSIPAAEITARGIPMTSEELRRRLGMASGGTHHLFGAHVDGKGNVLLVCSTPRKME